MSRNVAVGLEWVSIDWHPDHTWVKHTLERITDAGIDVDLIDRSVYVIRIKGKFCIAYENGESPTVYIGEGNFYQRITEHRKWARNLMDLVKETNFEVYLATPRVRNNLDVHRDCEAALLNRFKKKYGNLPLWNKQNESRLFDHHIYDEVVLDSALRIGKRIRYEWAVFPMRSSKFHHSYFRTL
ncbi:MAG: hypothetical protein WCI88_13330 [Chloroflexota bacterium]